MQVRTSSETGVGAEARLYFEGVDAAVVTRVRDRREGGLTVDQPLPFLDLSARVRDADGRSARIRSVGVSVRGSTPHLVLELSYDGRGDNTAPYALPRARRDDTLKIAAGAATASIEAPSQRADDATIVFAIEHDDAGEQPSLRSERAPLRTLVRRLFG